MFIIRTLNHLLCDPLIKGSEMEFLNTIFKRRDTQENKNTSKDVDQDKKKNDTLETETPCML